MLRKILLSFLFFTFILMLPQAHGETQLRILHVNDIYDVTPVKGKGGLAELKTAIKKAAAATKNHLITFGGDLRPGHLYPFPLPPEKSLILTNAVGFNLAVLGNHEFDSGVEALKEILKKSKYPWLGNNVVEKNGQLLQGLTPTFILPVDGFKIGFFGLLTPETASLSNIDDSVHFEPIEETARKAISTLIAQGADVIIALTHLTFEEDHALASKVNGIDLILGGHDHEPITAMVDDTLIHKSGHNAEYLGIVDLHIKRNPKSRHKAVTIDFSWSMQPIQGIKPDQSVESLIDTYKKEMGPSMLIPLGTISQSMDTRRFIVRQGSSAFANLLTDIARQYFSADIVITNGGSIRGNRIYDPKTTLTIGDILKELPFSDSFILTTVTGSQILEILEQGFRKAEELSGGFPHVSGMIITYDINKPAGHRVVSVEINGKPLEKEATYRLVINSYLAKGGDGYPKLPVTSSQVDEAISPAVLLINSLKAKPLNLITLDSSVRVRKVES